MKGNFGAEGLAARIRLESDPETDPAIREAFAALDEGDLEGGLDSLVEAIPSGDGRAEDLRRAVVGVLDGLGVEHPVAREYRRRLASALY